MFIHSSNLLSLVLRLVKLACFLFYAMVKKILMVCLGNTCRSPIAEAVMQHKIYEAGLGNEWVVDSAGIADWHQGKEANDRSLGVLKKYGLSYSNRARQIQMNDFNEFEYIFGMDEKNVFDLRQMAPENCKANIFLLGDFGLQYEDRIIEDPYFKRTEASFEKVYQQCDTACEAFLKMLLENAI